MGGREAHGASVPPFHPNSRAAMDGGVGTDHIELCGCPTILIDRFVDYITVWYSMEWIGSFQSDGIPIP